MSQKWRDATILYRQAEEHKLKVAPPQREVLVQEDTWRLQAAQIAEASRDFEQFLKSPEGLAAMALLGAAKRHLIFGEEAEGGYAYIAFIDGAGLQLSIEPAGTAWAYHKGDLPKPKISSITARGAIQAAVLHTKKKPHEVLAWLRGELDKIADAADSGEGI
jgi:hypothetical protein